MCKRLLPVSGSIVQARSVEGVVLRAFARWVRVEWSSVVSPVRER
jgi:hypothetical protein